MSDTLTTYHGDPKVKASLLRRISAHEKADRLMFDLDARRPSYADPDLAA